MIRIELLANSWEKVDELIRWLRNMDGMEVVRAEESATLARETDEGDDIIAEHLTARETEVLRMLADGLGNKEIAELLGISEHTAKFHVASILGKLNASSRTEAVRLGIRRGLIPI